MHDFVHPESTRAGIVMPQIFAAMYLRWEGAADFAK